MEMFCSMERRIRIQTKFLLIMPYLLNTLLNINAINIKMKKQCAVFTTVSCKSNNSNFTPIPFKCSKLHRHPTLLYLGNKKSANRVRYLQKCLWCLSSLCEGMVYKISATLLHFETAINEVYLIQIKTVVLNRIVLSPLKGKQQHYNTLLKRVLTSLRKIKFLDYFIFT